MCLSVIGQFLQRLEEQDRPSNRLLTGVTAFTKRTRKGENFWNLAVQPDRSCRRQCVIWNDSACEKWRSFCELSKNQIWMKWKICLVTLRNRRQNSTTRYCTKSCFTWALECWSCIFMTWLCYLYRILKIRHVTRISIISIFASSAYCDIFFCISADMQLWKGFRQMYHTRSYLRQVHELIFTNCLSLSSKINLKGHFRISVRNKQIYLHACRFKTDNSYVNLIYPICFINESARMKIFALSVKQPDIWKPTYCLLLNNKTNYYFY